MINFDFMHLYEELNGINEDTLFEGKQERGKYKKAFLNLQKGLYYDQQGNVHGEEADVVSTKYARKVKDMHNIRDIAKAYNIPDYRVDPDTGERTELSDSELTTAVNKAIKSETKNARVIHTHDVDGVGSYTAFLMFPSVLHHINGVHEDNAEVRSYGYKGNNGKRKYTYLFVAGSANLDNYLMIEATTATNAKYAHLLVHLLALVSAAVKFNKELVLEIAKAFDGQLEGKDVKFSYIADTVNMRVSEPITKLADLANTPVINKLASKYATTSSPLDACDTEEPAGIPEEDKEEE